jgi:hypothetical protein
MFSFMPQRPKRDDETASRRSTAAGATEVMCPWAASQRRSVAMSTAPNPQPCIVVGVFAHRAGSRRI